MIIGVIADDFTGASDIGLTLAARGMRTVMSVGVPGGSPPEADALVISLKSRSCPVEDAVTHSRAACRWLLDRGARQIVFKYCSTFDSTPQGNIGPVLDALIDETGTDAPVIVCPAFPATGRTVYQGHLFVNDVLLSDSGMRDHPVTPMTDPDLRRVLARQTATPVRHLPLAGLRAGEGRARMEGFGARPVLVVCDAIADADFDLLAQAAQGWPLLSGASGIAQGLPALHGFAPGDGAQWCGQAGPGLILSGSCSEATRGQLAAHKTAGHPVIRVDGGDIVTGKADAAALVAEALAAGTAPVLGTSADPAEIARVQEIHGAARSAEAVERFFSDAARAAVAQGVTRLVAAGGETSGAVVQSLDVPVMEIGPQIAAGVPALAVPGRDLALALKSGNFGQPDFFSRALRVLEGA